MDGIIKTETSDIEKLNSDANGENRMNCEIFSAAVASLKNRQSKMSVMQMLRILEFEWNYLILHDTIPY